MDAPGGRDRGKELDRSVAGELELPQREVVGQAGDREGRATEPARREAGDPRPGRSGGDSVQEVERSTEVQGAPGKHRAPDAPGGDEHP